MLKTQCAFTFFIFRRHLESIILYCVGQFKTKKMVSRAGETIVFGPRQEKVWKCLLIYEIPCPNGLEASFLNSASSIWEVLPWWNLWWKHYASTGSFAHTSNDFHWFLHGVCLFGRKRLASILSTFLVGARVATYSINATSNLCLRTLPTCASLATHSMNITSNLCSRALTTSASVATYSFLQEHAKGRY